jgi:hypothetical protein
VLAFAFVALVAAPSAVSDPPPIQIHGMPDDQTVEATSSAGATLTWPAPTATSETNPAVPVTCSPDSGSTFPLGVTKVTCTASDSGATVSKSFDVAVVDTTPPSVSVPPGITAATNNPAGAVVTFSASATDTVDGSVGTACSPSSGSTFSVGTTTVTCTATDSHGNTGSASFTVTVQSNDKVPPTVFVPSPITAEATAGSGAVVTFSASATDNFDGSVPTSCSPNSGSTFGLGTTTVTCTATDSSGNTGSASFGVTVQDTTPPTVGVPAPISAEATGPSGAVVTFSASASDLVSGSLAPSCSPTSGSTFAFGSATVTCSATDSHGNTGSATFTVTVQDTTPPVLTGVPAPILVEADGPLGSRATFTNPTASDVVDGGVPVNCSPGSNSLFGLGTTTVTCTATDAHTNVGAASFTITVRDTTKPVLNAPGPATFSSGGASQLSKSDPKVAAWLAAASATDLVDGRVPVTNDAPELLPLGVTVITFTARDQADNVSTSQSRLTVVTGEAPPANLDTTPPGEVRNLKVRPGDGFIELTWVLPKDADFDHLTISRSTATGSTNQTVYSGRGKRLKDRHLRNGIAYRYILVTLDTVGNRSLGAAARATPKRVALYSPVDGAVVTKPPVLRWARISSASYYNLQVYRLGASPQSRVALPGQKVLSVWPTNAYHALTKKWKFAGRTRRLTAGSYVWFVWPGFGLQKANRYGALLGQSTFVVR